MVRTKVVNNEKHNLPSFPLKDKSAIVILPSDNPLWDYEAYCYRGLFIGYLSPSDTNPLSNTK
jgi:hypothetical protein